MPVIAIVGAGPNLGLATARKFGSEGFDVGLVSRNPDRLEDLVGALRPAGITASAQTADLRRTGQATGALTRVAGVLGPIDVLVYSPLASLDWIKPVTDTSSDDMGAALELGVLGAVDSVDAVLPTMRERGTGTLLFTTGGAAVAPSPDRASSAVSNAAEVAYAKLLHGSLVDEGIHVAHTAIVGGLGPGLKHAPEDVAEVLWRQHVERDGFQHVVE